MKPILEVAHLTYGYDSKRLALQDISFMVYEGESVGIVGGNGAGKSTLLGCLLGLLRGRGKVHLFGEEISRRNVARTGVVFQNPEDQLFMPSLLDDVALPLVNSGWDWEISRSRARDALEKVGLRELAERAASQVSLGERKRASLAAVLVRSPELLLLDEPTAELDGRSKRQLTDLLNQSSITRVITSHDLSFLGNTTSRVLLLGNGKLLGEGATEEILSKETMLLRAGLI